MSKQSGFGSAVSSEFSEDSSSTVGANLRLVADSVPALIHTGRPDGHLDYFNRPWLDYLGLRLEDVEGWKWTAVIHPDDVDGILQKWRSSLASGEPFLHETRVRRADGEYRWMGHHKIPLHDENGKIVKWYGSSMDIEDRKRAENSMQNAIIERKRAEQDLQQLVDLVPQLIAVAAPDGKFTYANRVSREYTGLTLEEFRSIDVIRRIIHPDDVDKARAQRRGGFSGIDPFEYEARVLGKDGAYRWFLIRFNPLVEEGRVRKWYGTATEIETRKQEEQRVRQENVRLEERTRIAQELHDTLLQSFNAATMKLWASMDSLPSDSPLRPKLDPILGLMEQGIAEGRTAIQGLRSSDTGPSDLVEALSGIQKEAVVQPDVDFCVNVVGQQRPIPAPVCLGAYRIGKEALVNAFRYSGAKRIEVELEYSDTSLTLRVRDNGCGIDPIVLEKGLVGHWGLAGMRERAAGIGGELKILSSASAGTEIQLFVPGEVAFKLT